MEVRQVLAKALSSGIERVEICIISGNDKSASGSFDIIQIQIEFKKMFEYPMGVCYLDIGIGKFADGPLGNGPNDQQQNCRRYKPHESPFFNSPAGGRGICHGVTPIRNQSKLLQAAISYLGL